MNLRAISRKSYTVFVSVSINLSINIKTIPQKLTAQQELHFKLSKSRCSVTLRKHSKLTMGCMLETGKKIEMSAPYSTDVSHLLLHNVT